MEILKPVRCFFLVFLLFVGCSPKAEIYLKLRGVEEEIFSKRCSYWETFHGKLKLRAESEEKNAFYLASCFVDKDRFRIDLLSFWGQTIAVALVKEESITLWIPSESTIYKGTSSDLLEKLTGQNIPVKELISYLTGCLSDHSKKIKLMPGEEISILSIEDKNLKVTYSPFFRLIPAKTTPRTIRVHSHNGVIEIEVTNMERAEKFPDKLFEIEYPPNTLIKHL